MRKKLAARMKAMGLAAGHEDVEAVFAGGEVVGSDIGDADITLTMKFDLEPKAPE
jgi:hypothetical protein